MTDKQKLNEKCEFDKEDGCHALACFSFRECNSRDMNGYPKYIAIEKLIDKE